jgi:hypothetical protein
MHLLFAFFILSAPAAAAELTVHVFDADTSADIAGATAVAGATRATTGADGRSALSLDARPWTVQVQADGYADRAIEVDLTGNLTQAIEVALVKRGRFREQVEVSAHGDPVAEPVARIPVQSAEVVAVAGGGENVFHVLQTLPGVASPEEFSSRISVRGGGPDENLTVLDGVEIHNPYRLFGLVSAFNPETVETFDLSAGAFDVRHGDRLSSLLVVNGRAGSRDPAVSATAALSVTDTNLIVEGRAPYGNGSWLVAGRRTYYDLVAERFTNSDLPSFEDLQAKTVWSLGAGRRLSLFGIRSRESTDATFDSPKEGAEGAFGSRTTNDLGAVELDVPFGGRAVSRTVASGYVNTDAVDFGGNFRDKTRRANAPGDEAFGQSRVEVTWEDRVRDYALRQEMSFRPSSRHLLEAGGEVHRLETRIRFLIPADRNTQEANTSSLQGGSGLPEDLDSRRHDTRVGAYVKDTFEIASRLSLEGGVRLDRSTANERASWSPRLSAAFALSASTRLRAALGLYAQTPGYEKLVQADYFMDLTSTGPLALANERSRHALLGLERELDGGFTARVEGYYKGFDDLVVGRLETAAETAARVAEYDFPASVSSSVPIDPWITTVPTNDGKGTAYGFDVYLARRVTSSHTRLSGWGSYTYGLARREAYGRVYPFDYDRRHALSIVSALRLGRKLELATTIRASSGFPRTPVLGLKVAAVADAADVDGDGNRTELVPQRDTAGRLVYTTTLGGVSNLNTARMPMYARVDARLSFKPKGPQGRLKLYLDIINLLGRQNAGMLEPNLEYDPTSDRPQLVEKRTGSIPFLPSVGLHFDFSRSRKKS